jgi:methylglutaconyl-CoA hydratase
MSPSLPVPYGDMESQPTSTAPVVRSHTTGGVCTVTLDSPHNRNALSSALVGELLTALRAATADDSVRVVVLSHTGPVFCSGADLAEAAAGGGRGRWAAGGYADVLVTLTESPKPVVAQLRGAARGGGLGLVAAADIAVCPADATFAFSEVRLGLVPAVVSAVVLPRLTPRAAAELFLTGDEFTGVRAAEIGLVTAAVPEAEVEAAVAAYVRSLLRGGPQALAATRRLLQATPDARPLAQRVADLAALSAAHAASPEGREGLAAFGARREPAWVP